MNFVFFAHSHALRRPAHQYHPACLHAHCAYQLIPPTPARSHHRDVEFVQRVPGVCQDLARNGHDLHRRQGRGELACCVACIWVILTRITAHFHLTRQDGRTMLDYAKIAKSKGRTWRDYDTTIAFLQSCSCLPEFTAFVLARSRHVQTSPSLPPLLPHCPLPLRLLRLPPSTLVLLRSRSKSHF